PRAEQNPGGTDLKPIGASLLQGGILDGKAGAIVHFHGPIAGEHSIDPVNSTRQNMIEEMRLEGIQEPHAFGAAHRVPFGGVSQQRGAYSIIVSPLALSLRAEIVRYASP